jgi:hypothetical protein
MRPSLTERLEDALPIILANTEGSDNSTISCKSCVPGINILDSFWLGVDLFRADFGEGAAPANPDRQNKKANAPSKKHFERVPDICRFIIQIPASVNISTDGIL